MENTIRQHMPHGELFTFEVHNSIDSTNRRAVALAREGAPPFSAVIAREQTAGRGRMERSFHSPRDSGLYLSLVLPPLSTDMIGLLTPYAAVATAQAIHMVSGLECGVKWVNDLFAGGRKLCGILTEGAAVTEEECVAVVGIGINTRQTQLPPELADIVTNIEGETGNAPCNATLAAAVLEKFVDIRRRLATRDFMNEYRRRSVLTGKEVTVYGTQQYHATVVGIDDDCGLIVSVGGETRTISAGEVSVRANLRIDVDKATKIV